MLDNLKERFKQLSNKNNKKAVAQIFQNPEYSQDTHERYVQILFFKLLMIAAYSDGSVDDDELDVIKDYAFENCLTEQEWREINFFQQQKPTNEEIDKLQDEIVSELHSKLQKKELLRAIRDIVESDGIIKPEEKHIIESLEKKIKKSSLSFASSIIKKISNANKESKVHETAKKFSRNPIAPLLQKSNTITDSDKIEVISATLGLAIAIIHTDMEFHEKEKEVFIEIVKELCYVDSNKAHELGDQMLQIPDTYFEIAHLARILTEKISREERKEIMKILFRVAMADSVYDAYEDKYLRIINNSLLLEHKDFISVRAQFQSK